MDVSSEMRSADTEYPESKMHVVPHGLLAQSSSLNTNRDAFTSSVESIPHKKNTSARSVINKASCIYSCVSNKYSNPDAHMLIVASGLVWDRTIRSHLSRNGRTAIDETTFSFSVNVFRGTPTTWTTESFCDNSLHLVKLAARQIE